jgi:hypothetical protein
MTAGTGWGDPYRMGDWMPIVVDLGNRGKRVEGELQVVVPRSDGRSRTVYKKPVDLADAAKQRHFIYVRPDDLLSSEVNVILSAGPVQRQINLKTGKMRLLQQEDALILFLDSRPSGLSFLSGMYPRPPRPAPKRRGPGGNPYPGAGQQPNGEVRIAYASRAEDLPDDRRGYDLVHTVALGDMALDSLPPERLRALTDWVLSGGTLLVAGGADVRRLQSPALSALLPVKVTGVHAGGGAPLPALRTALSPGTTVDETVLKEGARYVPGTANAVALQPYGLGKVVFTAFDPADPNAAASRALWQGLLSLSSPYLVTKSEFNVSTGGNSNVVYGNPYNAPSWGINSFSQIATEMPSVGAPSFKMIGGYLLLYLLLLSPVNFVLLRRMRRPELAWVTVPAVILLFTFGSYGAGYAMKGGSLKLNEVTLVSAGSGARRATANSFIGLFSPHRHTYEVEVGQPGSALAPYLNDPNGMAQAVTYTSVQGEKPGLEGFSVNMWTVRGIKAERMVDLNGTVEGEFTVKKGAGPKQWIATGRVDNRTPYPIRKCVLRVGTLSSRPFDLPPGGTFNSSQSLIEWRQTPMAQNNGSDLLTSAYKQALSPPFVHFSLVGLTPAFPLDLRLDGRRSAPVRACVLTVRLPYHQAEGGAK